MVLNDRDGPNVIIRDFIRGRQGGLSHRRSEARSKTEVAALLASEIEEGAMSQGTQAAARSWKTPARKLILPQSLWKEPALGIRLRRLTSRTAG